MNSPDLDLIVPFGVPIVRRVVSEDIQNKVENKTIPHLSKLQHNREQFSDYNLPHDIKIVNQFDTQLPELAEEIKKLTYTYIKDTGFQMVDFSTLNDAWVQDYKKGDLHTEHNHGGQCISGLYWVRANEDAGDIVFLNPNPFLSLWVPSRQTELSTNAIRFKATRGTILLWPGYLTHKVMEGGPYCTRTTIAFNLDFIKEMHN